MAAISCQHLISDSLLQCNVVSIAAGVRLAVSEQVDGQASKSGSYQILVLRNCSAACIQYGVCDTCQIKVGLDNIQILL